MAYELMNGETKVLTFDFDDMYIHVDNNDFLPYSLKDSIKDSNLSDKESAKRSLKDIERIKDFLTSRILSFSRENAKAILKSAGFSQLGRINNKLDIALKCNCPNVKDNFWVNNESRPFYFFEVNLRNILENEPDEVSYDIAIMGETIKTDYKRLLFDMTTGGVSTKYWKMTGGGLELWKTDNINGVKSRVEINSSYYANAAGGNALNYKEWVRDGMVFSSCKCMTDDKTSLTHAQDIFDWLNNTNKDREKFIKDTCLIDFANMCVCDFVLANIDRHNENWGFYVDNKDNSVKCLAPLYDFNQALIPDGLMVDIKDVIYPPTDKTFVDTLRDYAIYSNVDFSNMRNLPKRCKDRWEVVKRIKDGQIIL